MYGFDVWLLKGEAGPAVDEPSDDNEDSRW